MIDSCFRTPYQTVCVDPIVKILCKTKTLPQTLTLFALLTGIATAPMLYLGHPYVALICLLISGYLDTLDGSLARAQGSSSPKGAVLDIVSDRAVEFAIIFGLYLVDPATRGTLCFLMLGSVLICVTSFLVVGIFLENEGNKSFHYHPGIMERTEAFVLFGMMMLFTDCFSYLSVIFTILVLVTAITRIKDFTRNS